MKKILLTLVLGCLLQTSLKAQPVSQPAPYNTNYAAYSNFSLQIGLTNGGAQAALSIQSSLSNLTYQVLSNSTLEPNVAGWPVWGTFRASNSVTVAPPIDFGAAQMYLASQLVLITGTNQIPDWWQMLYFGSLGIDPAGNPAGDGISNLRKYQLGLNPRVFDYAEATGTNGLVLFTVLQ